MQFAPVPAIAICIAVLQLVTVFSGAAGREFKNCDGNEVADGELIRVDVVIQISDEQEIRVPFDTLDERDRKFVLEQVSRGIPKVQGTATAPERGPNKAKIASLKKRLNEAIFENDVKSIESQIESLFRIDPSGRWISSIDNVISVANEVALGEKSPSSKGCETALFCFAQSANYKSQALDKWLQERADTQILVIAESGYGLNNSGSPLSSLYINQFLRINRAMAKRAKNSAPIASRFAAIQTELKSAPNPSDRARAAFGLASADDLAAELTASLIAALKTDVAKSVRKVAAFSLALYPELPPEAEREFERIAAEDWSYYEIWAIRHSNSPRLQRKIRSMIEYYQGSQTEKAREGMGLAIALIERAPSNFKWAIADLIKCAETSSASSAQSIAKLLVQIDPSDPRVFQFLVRRARDGDVICDTLLKSIERKKPKTDE